MRSSAAAQKRGPKWKSRRTLYEDLLEGSTFESVEELEDELQQYLLYYNTARPHQALNGNTPLETLELPSTN